MVPAGTKGRDYVCPKGVVKHNSGCLAEYQIEGLADQFRKTGYEETL